MTFAVPTLLCRSGAAVTFCLLSVIPLHAQGTLADYQRAHELRVKPETWS